MTDTISKGDISNGVYPIYTRGALIDFILHEPSTPNGAGRQNVEIDASQHIGLFCDDSGVAVKLAAAADVAKIAGVLISDATAYGLTAQYHDVMATMLTGSKLGVAELKETVLTLNGFRNVQFNGSKFTCTGLDGVTGTGAATTAQAVLDAVIANLDKQRINFVSCGA